MTWP
jgi:hypothetical protein